MPRTDRLRRASPAELACDLARDRFWRDEHRRLIGTHPDWPDAAHFLELSEELAHALVLVLSRLPAAVRREFADDFYELRDGRGSWLPDDPRQRLALAAAVVLAVAEVLDDTVCDELMLDFVRGAAQGDDLTHTPRPAVERLERSIARIRFDVDFDDPADPRGAAALALAEVLDPASDTIDLKEVLARCAWAAVETRDLPGTLGFLLHFDGLLRDD
jgi:hypothetical protein